VTLFNRILGQGQVTNHAAIGAFSQEGAANAETCWVAVCRANRLLNRLRISQVYAFHNQVVGT
jgi:hypothetical protein